MKATHPDTCENSSNALPESYQNNYQEEELQNLSLS